MISSIQIDALVFFVCFFDALVLLFLTHWV